MGDSIKRVRIIWRNSVSSMLCREHQDQQDATRQGSQPVGIGVGFQQSPSCFGLTVNRRIEQTLEGKA